MNGLTPTEAERLNHLIVKMRSNTATSPEMREFVHIIKKSGDYNNTELQHYMAIAGLHSIEEFTRNIDIKSNQEFVEGLIKIGLAVLFAYVLIKALSKK